MDLLGCPLCNSSICKYVGQAAIEQGHITDGKYVLINHKDQYLLFTAGLQDIKLS